MKVTRKEVLVRRYHVSALMFLLALGLLPASLLSNGAAAETVVTEKAAEQTEVPTSEAMEAISKVEVAEIAEDFEIYVAPAVQVYDQINIAGNTIPIFYSSNTLIDAGSQVGLYGNHFLYGHNTANVFGGLSSMGVGSRFTVTLGGTTKTYQVMGSDLQTKSHFEEDVIIKATVAGVTQRYQMKMMRAITSYGAYGGNYYDYILMTCAGTSYGNGDASHRLVLLANEV